GRSYNRGRIRPFSDVNQPARPIIPPVQLEKVKIKRIIGPTPSGAAVLLGNEKKTFVVFVGFFEAAALIREINHEIPARPLTHELIQTIFLGFDVHVKHVVISSILENTFCATLILEQAIDSSKEEGQGRGTGGGL